MKQEDIDRLPLITREVLARVEARAAERRHSKAVNEHAATIAAINSRERYRQKRYDNCRRGKMLS